MSGAAWIVDEATGDAEDTEVAAALHAFRERLEAIHQGELTRAIRRAGPLSPEVHSAIETLSVAILRRVFDQCAITLRDSCQRGQGRGWARSLSELFGLSP